jgi:nucleotide-binding universal stress UspA family protein
LIHHVLVAVDGSDGSRKAAEFARDLVVQLGARLTVLIAVEPPSVASLGAFDATAIRPSSPTPEHLTAADAIAHSLAIPADRLAVAVEVGHPVDVICAQAASLAADLVVVGSSGHGRTGAFLLGSVSDEVVRKAGRPVTVVH